MMRISPAQRLHGRLSLPGDKSLSHRHILRAAMVEGRSVVGNVATGRDVSSTLYAVEALGVKISRHANHVVLDSPGIAGWRNPGRVDCGNSGTTARLLMGLLAASPFSVELVGDASLSSRPMARVAEPLRRMGATLHMAGDGLPLRIQGGPLTGIDYELPVASAQLKSAVLLAGMQASGETRVLEAVPSRDHTERLFGLGSQVKAFESQGKPGLVREWVVSNRDLPRKVWDEVKLPADPSTAAFFVVAALLLEEGELELPDLLVNPYRRDFLDELMEWGAAIQVEELPGEGFCGPLHCSASGCNPGEQCPIAEPVAHVKVQAGLPLSARLLEGRRIPRLLDEIPVLAVAAMASDEPFEVRHATELRVKESDRLAGTAELLRAFGGTVEEKEDGFRLLPPERIRAGHYNARGDHRLAMAAVVLALAADGDSHIEGLEHVAASHPDFLKDLGRLTGSTLDA